MANHLYFVVEAFDCGIGNPEMEVVEDFVLMLSDDPSELPHRVQPGMTCG